MTKLHYIDLGSMAYKPALDLQKQVVERVKSSPSELAYLLMVRHDPPVITLGSSSCEQHVLASPDQLARRGIEVHRVGRGGGATYHGPGQLVGYPIIRLDLHGRDIHSYLRQLEDVLIRLLGRLDISAQRTAGLTGVWVGGKKIAAIGVAVSRWVTYHGFCLNVSADLSAFDLIVPCGMSDRPLTSMEHQLGYSVSMDRIQQQLSECFAEVFGLEHVAHSRAIPNLRSDMHARDIGFPKETGRRFPAWLRRRFPADGRAAEVHRLLSDFGLSTVCSGAHCPNQPECFTRGTATFLILGPTCTRSCRFCAIESGACARPRDDEPPAVAKAARQMGLRHVVITSVTRDDLPDGGADHFAATLLAVRRVLPQSVIEVLVPDFQGLESPLKTVLAARPDVFGHNVETVPRLYVSVRPQGDYRRSLDVLALAKKWAWAEGVTLVTKSGLMVGLGETEAEVCQVMVDLRQVECDVLTIGQYLAPSVRHAPVRRYVEPPLFEAWESLARAMGFRAVASRPFVRSSYQAEDVFRTGRLS